MRKPATGVHCVAEDGVRESLPRPREVGKPTTVQAVASWFLASEVGS